MANIPDLTVKEFDSTRQPFTATLKFDELGKPIFDEFFSDGLSLEHGLALLYRLFHVSSLHDFDVLAILDKIAGMRLPYGDRVAIVNSVIGVTLDMWAEKGHFTQMDSIFNKIKTIQKDVLEEATTAPERDTARIREMDARIKHLTERDRNAQVASQFYGRQ